MRWETHTGKALDLNISYTVAGGGPPLVLVHGAAASSVTWCDNIGPLSQHYTVYAPDLPAHGDSGVPHGDLHKSFGDPRFLLDFMDNLGIEKASLIGNSGGGSISAMFSLRHPERVDRLVLVDAGGLGRSVSWFIRIASLPLVGKILHLHTINSDRALVASIFHKPRPIDPEIARELRRARNSWHTRMAVVQAIRAGFNIFGVKKELILLDQLRGLDVPLFIVWGEKDGILPVSHALEASKRLPNAKLHIMRDCGHWPHMENPEEFNKAVIQFLEEPESVKGATGWASRKE